MQNQDQIIISQYLSEIQKTLQSGAAPEHAYRPAFQKLIKDLRPDIEVINEPAYTGGNAPDFLFKKGETPIAYFDLPLSSFIDVFRCLLNSLAEIGGLKTNSSLTITGSSKIPFSVSTDLHFNMPLFDLETLFFGKSLL